MNVRCGYCTILINNHAHVTRTFQVEIQIAYTYGYTKSTVIALREPYDKSHSNIERHVTRLQHEHRTGNVEHFGTRTAFVVEMLQQASAVTGALVRRKHEHLRDARSQRMRVGEIFVHRHVAEQSEPSAS